MCENKKSFSSRFLVILIALVAMVLMLPQSVNAATKVGLDKTLIKSVVGMNYSLTLKGVPTKDLNNGSIQWYTSNSRVNIVSTVNEIGKRGTDNNVTLELKGAGTTVVTARYKGRSYKCKVTCYAPKGYVTVETKSTLLLRSKESTFTLDTSKNKTASIKLLNIPGCTVSFSNIDTAGSNVISVSKAGKITAKNAGRAHVSVYLVDKKSRIASMELYSFYVEVKKLSSNTGFVLNKDYRAMELSTYSSCTKEAVKVRNLVNNWRKKKGFKAIPLSSTLSHSAGYLMRAYGGESKNDVYSWWYSNDHGAQCDRDVTNVVKAYKFNGLAYLIYVESDTSKNIFNDLLKDMNGIDYLTRCKTMGMYTTARGTFVLFGF